MPPRESYDWLRAHAVDTAMLSSCAALLHWDQATKLPPKGHEHRTNQLAHLAKLIHERVTDPMVGEALSKARAQLVDSPQDSIESANIREWKRAYDRAVKVPRELAEALARAASEGEMVWKQAREDNDWQRFKPYLENIISLRREEAQAVGFKQEPYDALLDEYEPGETAATLEPIFAELRTALVPLLDKIMGASHLPDKTLLSRHCPLGHQKAFVRESVAALGYDMQAGRLDSTAHPFSTRIGPGDTRITTRFDEHNLPEAFFGAMHEAGHALYSQGILAEHFGTPCGTSVSLGVHESQSRLWENSVARSLGFWEHFLPLAQKRFDSLKDVAVDDFHFAVNTVEPSLIRVEADEVTYNLHVMLRFELELALFRGDLEAQDLPEAWNEKMQEFLGITPPDHASGVMQDVHWSCGLMGYFPTYTLGNIYAAQIFETLCQELGNVEELFRQGDFAPVRDWLRSAIHTHGSRFEPRDLMQRATGQPLSSAALINSLTKKYTTLYRL